MFFHNSNFPHELNNDFVYRKEEMDRLKEDVSKKEDIVKERLLYSHLYSTYSSLFSAAKLNLLESEMSAEKKERSKLQAEMRLNVGDLQEKSEESFKKDTQYATLYLYRPFCENSIEESRT